MSDRRDPFDALRQPSSPLAPRADFAASLRRRVERELGMTRTDHSPLTSVTPEGVELAMVHLRVADADRAMGFFEALFGWEGERVEFGGHLSHYVFNTSLTVKLHQDPEAPAVLPMYRVEDVAEAIRAIEGAGGRVIDTDPGAEPRLSAEARDDQGLALLVYRSRGDHPHPAVTQTPSGDLGLVFIREDATRSGRFYGSVLGWRLRRAHPTSHYFDAVARVGVFDEAAAFGTEVTPSATLYFAVQALAPALARLEELGGRAGDVAHDMGPYFTSLCTDDQNTEFGIMSEVLG